MKIVIAQDVLAEGLQRVFAIIPQKPTLPVLSNFLLNASPGTVSIAGTDMDLSITTVVPCTVEREGSIGVNAKKFLGIVRELPEGDVTVTVEANTVRIVFEKGDFSLQGLPSDEYPALRDTLEGTEVILSGNDLADMVEKTAFSVSQDRTRISLTGVYWYVSQEQTMMVSTDGHRLSLFGRKRGEGTGGNAEVIVPPKTLTLSSQMTSSGLEIRRIVLGEKAILFDFGTTTIFSKLIEGPYPNFRQVIPTTNSKKVIVLTEDIEAAVRRVSVLSSSITHLIKLSISPGIMELSSKNEDISGESQERLPVKYEGEPITAGYNALFLSEILKRIDSDEALIELEAPTTACIIKPAAQKETDECVYLIMPLRLGE